MNNEGLLNIAAGLVFCFPIALSLVFLGRSHARSGIIIMAAQEPSPPSSLEGNKPGFPRKILANKLEEKHLCNICQKILRRPFQAQCGHRFCSYCFNKTVRSVRRARSHTLTQSNMLTIRHNKLTLTRLIPQY